MQLGTNSTWKCYMRKISDWKVQRHLWIGGHRRLSSGWSDLKKKKKNVGKFWTYFSFFLFLISQGYKVENNEISNNLELNEEGS